MTEEKKTPSLEDITKSFYEKCECTRHSYDLSCNKPCDYCGVGVSGINSGCSGEGTSMGECVQKYIYEVATGARDINKPLWNPPKTPEWLKVGDKWFAIVVALLDIAVFLGIMWIVRTGNNSLGEGGEQ